MKTSQFLALFCAVGAAAILIAGCQSDGAAPAATGPKTAAEMGPAPAGINTVKLTIDSNPPGSALVLNDVQVGHTPRDVHFEVDETGRMLYGVNIRVIPPVGISRMLGPAPESGEYTYTQGMRVPKRILFMGRTKAESPELAPYDTAPTPPTARRMESEPGPARGPRAAPSAAE